MDIGQYLKDSGVAFEVHEHLPAYTAQEMAAEEHISGNLVAKAVVIQADGQYAICALPASFKLDVSKVAKAMKAKKVRLADEQEMAKLFPDVEVGAEPPFGNLYNIPTLVDQHLADDEQIIIQAGSHRRAIRLKFADYASLVKPAIADLAVHL